MELNRVRKFIDWFAGSGLQGFDFKDGDFSIRLTRPQTPAQTGVPASAAPAVDSAPTAAPDAPADPASEALGIEAPLYGICHSSPAPGQPPFVQVGQTVKAGDTVCLIEAMKVINAVTAPRDGVVKEILVQDGTEIEQGELLLVLQ
jgi:acetyl-CoA carboxylase biotin carboxyl carrier protein